MKITLHLSDNIFVIDPQKICYCSAIENRIVLYYDNNQTIDLPTNIDKIAEELAPFHFFRLNKMHLINIHFIEKVNMGMDSSITLKNNIELPISEDRKQAITTLLNQTFIK